MILDRKLKNTKRGIFMKKSQALIKTIVLAMLIAIGVVISPILRVEGMCTMAHVINIICSVFLGPWYSLLCATLIGIIRMITMGIPPIALTGAVFGAFLSGVFYRASKGKIICAVFGEIIGTGIIGAIMSYPVMTYIWGREGLSWLFYVPSFICGTLIGGGIAYVLLKKLAVNGALSKLQSTLGTKSYKSESGVLSDAVTIASTGTICFVAVQILINIFKPVTMLWSYLSYSIIAVFIISALLYLLVKKLKKEDTDDRQS